MRLLLFRLIGILEVAGGLYGLGEMLHRLRSMGSMLGSVHTLMGIVLYGFVLGAGILLMSASERGVRLSGWAQLLQLPLLATPVFSYALHCGAYLNLYTTSHLARPWLDGNFGTQGYALALAGPGTSRLGINLLALVSWLALKLR